MHQERLGGNLDAGALGENHAAAVNDVENGDGLARFALGVERIAAEIDEIESDAGDEQDWPRVARLGDVGQPVWRRVRVERLLCRGRGGKFGNGGRDLFGEFQIEWLGKTLRPNP